MTYSNCDHGRIKLECGMCKRDKEIARLSEIIAAAVAAIENNAGIDGEHHKQWTLDQAIRALLGGDEKAYKVWRAAWESGEMGPNTYEWDEGIAP